MAGFKKLVLKVVRGGWYSRVTDPHPQESE
jgi:hypothetical protein